VVALPTEDIKEDVFYRLLTGTWVFNQFVQNHMICHCVETLPETGEPAVSGDLSNLENATITTYYNVSDESVYGYVTDVLSGVFGVPVGWYPASALMQAVGFTFAGIIADLMDNPRDGQFRLLLSYEVYYHKNKPDIEYVVLDARYTADYEKFLAAYTAQGYTIVDRLDNRIVILKQPNQ
jgi:hypothetical protein